MNLKKEIFGKEYYFGRRWTQTPLVNILFIWKMKKRQPHLWYYFHFSRTWQFVPSAGTQAWLTFSLGWAWFIWYVSYGLQEQYLCGLHSWLFRISFWALFGVEDGFIVLFHLLYTTLYCIAGTKHLAELSRFVICHFIFGAENWSQGLTQYYACVCLFIFLFL